MFETKIRIAANLMLMALTSSVYSSLPEKDAGNEGATKFPEMFPDGLAHDFGKVRRGTQAKHAFRVVNTSNVPLRIVSVRNAMGPVMAQMNKNVLQPYEEGKVEVVLDTRRFDGLKTVALFLTMDNGTTFETRFIITANSQDDPQEQRR